MQDNSRWLLSGTESSGPLVFEPARQGSGARLSKQGFPADLGGDVGIRYAKSGLARIITGLS